MMYYIYNWFQNNLSKLIPENLFLSFKQTILEAYDDNEDGLYENMQLNIL